MVNVTGQLGRLCSSQAACVEDLLLFVLVFIFPMWLNLCTFSPINISPTTNNQSRKYVCNKTYNLEIIPFYKSFKNVNIFLANNDMHFKYLNPILSVLLLLDYRLISVLFFPTYLLQQETMKVIYHL